MVRSRKRKISCQRGSPGAAEPSPPAAGAALGKLGAWLGRRFVGPVLIAAAAVVMLSWTWRTWPDPVVDFGRELYVPWQLSVGKVLYSDVATHNGPLSQYWNAMWFTLFGPSLSVLVASNLVLLALLIFVLYHALVQVGSRFSAAASCLAFVTVFAFGQYVRIGNYNYVCPYSHEITHGVLLSLVAVVSVWSYRERGLVALFVGGLALGLSFLTKAEVFLPGAVGAAAALVLTILVVRPSRRRALAMFGTFVGAAAVPVAAAFAALCAAMPAGEALRGTLGTWVVAASRQVTGLKFYREMMGTSDIAGNLRELLIWSGWYAAILIPLALLALAVRKKVPYRLPMAAVCFIGVAWLLLAREIQWGSVARPLPLFMLIFGVSAFVLFLRRRNAGESGHRLVRQISLTVFALAMLVKMLLSVQIFHYGFVLAMPATLVLVTALLDWLPAAVARLGGDRLVLRAGALALIVSGAAAYIGIQRRVIRRKTLQVAAGSADSFRAGPRGLLVDEAVRQINQRAGPGESLAVFPEGVMLNYLCRRPTPTRYINFMPLEMSLFGEQRMLASFQARPPDWIAIVHKDTSEYGPRFFGKDYGRRIYDWIGQTYRPVMLIGAPPLQDKRFGILLLGKKGGPPGENDSKGQGSFVPFVAQGKPGRERP